MAILKKLLGSGMPWGLATALEADIGDGLIATGTTQADALQIGYAVARFASVAAGSGAILQANSVGDAVLIVNGGTNALSLYPPSGQAINALAANAAFSVASGSIVCFKRITNAAWLAIVGDAAASTFLQSGTGAVPRTTQSKLREAVSVTDFGAKGNGTTDDTTAIQEAVDSLGANGGAVFVPPGSYTLSSTITFLNKRSVLFSGLASASQAGSATQDSVNFKWNGSAGGTAFLLDGVRDSTFERFQIVQGSANYGVAVDIDRINGTSVTPTNNLFKDVFISCPTNATGIRTGNIYKSNVDLHLFEDVIVAGVGGSTGTTGYAFNSANSHGHLILKGSVASLATGINFAGGGAHCYGVNFSNNATSISNSSRHDMIISGCNEESTAGVFYAEPGGLVGNSQNLLIEGCRLSGGNASTANYINFFSRGTLTLLNNDFAEGIANATFGIRLDSSTYGSQLIAIGNNFPNNTPYTPITGTFNANVISLGNTYQLGTGLSAPLGDRIGPLGTTTGNSLTLNIASGGSTTISTGVGSVKMSTGNGATNTAWIPISYAGTTYYVPAWTTNAP